MLKQTLLSDLFCSILLCLVSNLFRLTPFFESQSTLFHFFFFCFFVFFLFINTYDTKTICSPAHHHDDDAKLLYDPRSDRRQNVSLACFRFCFFFFCFFSSFFNNYIQWLCGFGGGCKRDQGRVYKKYNKRFLFFVLLKITHNKLQGKRQKKK